MPFDPNRPSRPVAGLAAAALLLLGLQGCTQNPDARAPNKDLGQQPLQADQKPQPKPEPQPEPKPEPKPEPPIDRIPPPT